MGTSTASARVSAFAAAYAPLLVSNSFVLYGTHNPGNITAIFRAICVPDNYSDYLSICQWQHAMSTAERPFQLSSWKIVGLLTREKANKLNLLVLQMAEKRC